MTIPNYRLPPGIERGARGGPEWSTIVQMAISGREKRIQQRTSPRRVYDIGYALMHSDDPAGDFAGVLALHLAHQGKTYPFRFKDWSDYSVSNQVFATGPSFGGPYSTDGSRTQFQLGKGYNPYIILGSGLTTGLTFTRALTCIVGVPLIEIDTGGGFSETFDWSLDGETGLVTFDTPPPLESSLRWTGEWDVPVRFDSDHLPVVMNVNDIMSIASITIREVIGETAAAEPAT